MATPGLAQVVLAQRGCQMREPQAGAAHPMLSVGFLLSGNPTRTEEWEPGPLPPWGGLHGVALGEQRAGGSGWPVLGRAPQRWTLDV